MTNIKAADVAKLRKQTGAGMMDCKKALVESNGSFDDAITILRKKGQKVAAKRADREAGEGVAVTKINSENTSGVAIVLACETDFVAKNDSFKKLAEEFAEVALNFENKESFLSASFNGMSVSEKLIEQTGVIGEKIEISSFEKVDAKYVGSYTHGIKIAVLVGFDNIVENIITLSKDIAMQVASMGATTLSYKDFGENYIASETEARIAVIEKENIELSRLGKTLKNVPKYISMAQISSEILNNIEDEIKDTLRSEGKPEHIWDKIVPGKIERFISDNTTLDQEQCLLDQKFIKDESQNVDSYIKTYGDISVSSFKRVSLGS
tara:strand:- start:998 stop:1966 length:969 start_codon:yes stop_codon:yes gene_type:complete